MSPHMLFSKHTHTHTCVKKMKMFMSKILLTLVISVVVENIVMELCNQEK